MAEKSPPLSRRSFLKAASGCAGAAGLAAATSIPRLAYANAPVPRNIVVICLEGGLDGVMTVAPYLDSAYHAHRGETALLPPGMGERSALDLDGYFGLHPRMTQMHDLYNARELSFFHAVSFADFNIVAGDHFGGLRNLYYGGAQDNSGFLNRLALELHGQRSTPGAVALTESDWRPEIINGAALAAGMRPNIPPPSDQQLIDRLKLNFGASHELNRLLTDAVNERLAMRSSLIGHEDLVYNSVIGNSYSYLPQMMEIIALMMRGDAALRPNIFFTRLSGYDLHGAHYDHTSGQHQSISNGIWALRNALKGNAAQGISDLWKDTLVFVMTEFGRTLAMNGDGGTDHGTGGLLMVASGNAALMRSSGASGVGALWPGCANLGPNNSLAYTADSFDIMRAYMAAHFTGYYASGAMDRVLPRRAIELRTMPGASGANVSYLNSILS